MPRFFSLFAAALSTSTLSACAALGIGGTFELDVEGTDLARVRTLYVIVSDAESVKVDPVAVSELVGSARHEHYRTFAQFEPVREKEWRWQELMHEPASALVSFESDEDQPVLHVEIEQRDLLEIVPDATVTLLVRFDDKSWKSKSLKAERLANEGELSLLVSASGFAERGSK